MSYKGFLEAQENYDNMSPPIEEDEDYDDCDDPQDDDIDDPDFDYDDYLEDCRRAAIERDEQRFLDHLYNTTKD